MPLLLYEHFSRCKFNARRALQVSVLSTPYAYTDNPAAFHHFPDVTKMGYSR